MSEDAGVETGLVALLATGYELLTQRKSEAAIGPLEQAAARARQAQDYGREGEAEVLLWHAYRATGAIGAEHSRLTMLHADRAELAFRTAGDSAGVARALTLQIVALLEEDDPARLGYAMDKLDETDPRQGPWWHDYADAALHSDPATARAALERCLANIDLLTENKEGWRAVCERRLAFLTGQLDSIAAQPSVQDELRSAVFASTTSTAKAHIAKAIAAAERDRGDIRSEVKQRELSATLDPVYIGAATIAHDDRDYERAVDVIELNTSRSLMSRFTMRHLWMKSPVTSFDALGEAGGVLTDAMLRYYRAGGPGELQGVEVALRRRREAAHRAEEQLVELVPPPHVVFKPIPSARLRSVLADDQVVVVFAPSGAVYGIDNTGTRLIVDADRVERERTCVELAELYARAGATSEERMAARERIASAVLGPLAPIVRERKRVMVVPDGALWRVPLAVLARDILGSECELTYVPSMSIAGMLLNLPVRERHVERFLGVANPDGTLPYAEREVTAAASTFDLSTICVRERATTSVLLYALDSDVIHISSHGGFFEDYPELAWLQIAATPANVLLFAADVVRMSGLVARLVVLAACSAGTGVELPGREYVGLPAAFMCAGIRSVIAPLWDVDDASTATLMEYFYEELKSNAPATALWNAQCRVRSEPATADPFHWAAFQQFGLP